MAADDLKAKKGIPCPKCGNRLRVRPDQLGEEVRCPKCNATFTIGKSSPKKAAVSADDEYEPERPLKPATIVPEEPAMLESSAPAEIMPMQAPPTSHLPHYEADWASDELEMEAPQTPPPRSLEPDYLEIARQRGLVREENEQTIPNWTFFSGVFAFPWQLANLGRWMVMAIGLTLSLLVIMMAAEQLAGGVRGTTLTLPMLSMFAAAMSLVTLMFCSACFIAAVDDTADGHDEVQEATMPPMDQWLFSFFSVIHLWLMSGALGYPLVFIPQIGPIGIPISSLLLFPILFLSALECDSFFLPWSPGVWKSLVRLAGTWLAFYLVSTLLLGGWFVGSLFLLGQSPYGGVVLVGPALAAVMLIYARLLGRLGWRLAYVERPTGTRKRRPGQQGIEAPPVATSFQDTAPRPEVAPQSTTASRKSKKRKKVRRLKLPDDLDQPSAPREAEQPVRPRIDFHKRP
jgi:predicted Zn finger-like uncharacterized protein